MKLYITLKDISQSGGGERVCVNLANALSEWGFEVEILSFFQSAENPAYTLNKSIKLHYLSSFSSQAENVVQKLWIKVFCRAYLSYKIDTIITKNSPHILIANDGWYLPRKKLKTTRYLRIWHLNAPKITRRKKHNLALFDTLIILSQKDLSIWQKFHSNIKVIPNFLPTLPKINTNSEQKRVISVGRMDKGDQKGFLRLIDIWNLVQDNEVAKDWQLIIVGDGELKEQIESKILSLNLQDSITLKPFTKDIESQYLQASIYVMASHFEGLPMVLLESCSYGLCPVSFDIATGPSDIIVSGSSGYLVEDNDLQGFSEKILELMTDSQKRETFGKNAKQKVAESFSKEAVMKMWEKLICDNSAK